MDEFKRTLFILASSYEVQNQLFPDFTCKGDEMVIDFGDALESVDKALLPATGLRALEELDKYLIKHSSEEYTEHYLDNGFLKNSEIWKNIRQLSSTAISALAWEYEVPKHSGAEYISNDET